MWQGYSPPRPKPCFSGTQPLQPSVVQQSHWQYIPADPTEEFFDQSKDSAQAKHQIIPDALPCLPATRNLLAQSVTVPDGLVEWNTGILVDLSLWGSEKEDDGSREGTRVTDQLLHLDFPTIIPYHQWWIYWKV